MTLTRIQRAASNRYVWAAFAGLLLGAAFPKLGLAGLAWAAPGLILFSALGTPGGQRLRIGYVAGLASYLVSLHWLLFIPFPAGAVAGWIALSAYLALYPAAWVWVCWRIFPAESVRQWKAGQASSPHSGIGHRPSAIKEPDPIERRTEISSTPEIRLLAYRSFLETPLLHRLVWALGCAAVWVGLEMILARLFTGFPWNFLGVSQYQILPLLQIAPFTGVYGVSFLVAWFSVALAIASLNLVAHPTKSKAWLGDLALPLVTVLAVAAYGSSKLARRQPAARTLDAVLIQPSIPQTLIWDTNQNAVRFSQLIQLSERALDEITNAQLLIWPEAAVPNLVRYDLPTYQAITNLAISHRIWMIIGADDAVLRPGSEERQVDYYNSSFLVSPEGLIAGTYRKRRLVIFGEYVPLVRWLPFMKYLTPIGPEGFASGTEPVAFRIPPLDAATSVLICFEDVFPHLARESAGPDIDFLLNLTNNGWFGESAAQWQHAANAVFRAVENRLPLVRCANNGLTCWITEYGAFGPMETKGIGPAGQLVPLPFDAPEAVYGRAFKTANIPLLAPNQERAPTFYTRHGDVFGWTCVGLAGLLVGLGIFARAPVRA